MSNYPSGMSLYDLIYVGAIDDPEDFRPCANCGMIWQDHGEVCALKDLNNQYTWETPDEESDLTLPEYEPGEFEEPDYS